MDRTKTLKKAHKQSDNHGSQGPNLPTSRLSSNHRFRQWTAIHWQGIKNVFEGDAHHTTQCNPVVRANRVMKTMIAQNIKKSQKTWDVQLAELQFAYNTANNSTTGFSPAFLNFGRELRTPGSLAHQTALPTREKYEQRIKKLHEAIELARSHIAKSFQKQHWHYNLRRRKWTPDVGDKVLKKTHFLSNKIGDFNAKLAEKFEGPYTVYKKVSSNVTTPTSRALSHPDYRNHSICKKHAKSVQLSINRRTK